MAEIYRKNPYSLNQSRADIENLVTLLNLSEQKNEVEILTMKRNISRLHQLIKSNKKELRDYIQTMGFPEYMPVLAETLEDDSVPDTLPQSYLDYQEPKRARSKIFIDETVMATQRVIRREMAPVESAIRDRIDRISRLKQDKAKIEYELQKRLNVQGEAYNKRRENIDSYTSLMNSYFEVQELISKINAIKDLFVEYPDKFTTENAVSYQDDTMDWSCTYYRQQMDVIVNDFKEFGSDHPDLTDSAISIIEILTNDDIFSAQFPQAVKKAVEVAANLDYVNQILYGIRDEYIRGSLDALAGKKGIKNEELKILINRSLLLLDSEVKASTTDKVNEKQVQEVNKNYLDEAVKYVDNVKKQLERYGTAAGDFVDKGIMGLISLIGFARKNNKVPQTSLEDRWREEIRNKYGGDVGFCDEVKGLNKDGVISWMKKDVAVEIRPGEFISKTLYDTQQYQKSQTENKTDVY